MTHTTTHRVVTLDLPMLKGKPEWWDEAVDHLSRDPLLGSTVELYSDEYLSGRGEIFQTLVRSIVGQQISVKAGDTIPFILWPFPEKGSVYSWNRYE